VDGCASFDQVPQVSVQTVDGTASFLGELVAPIGQHSQHRTVVFDRNGGQALPFERDDRDGAGVDLVGLSAMAAVEEPDLTHEQRWDIEHGFTMGDELLRDETTQTSRPFDRPDPLSPLVGPCEQLASRCPRRADLDRAELVACRADRGRGVGVLVRVDADHGADHGCPQGLSVGGGDHGGQPEFKSLVTPLSSHAAAGGDRPARYERATPKWARSVRASRPPTSHPTDLQSRVLPAFKQVRSLREQAAHHCLVRRSGGCVPSRPRTRQKGWR
jgi:hypothetical protein